MLIVRMNSLASTRRVPVGIHRMQNGHAMGAALALEEDFVESMGQPATFLGHMGLSGLRLSVHRWPFYFVGVM